MSALLMRRIMVWTLGLFIGALISFVIIQVVLPGLSPDPNARAISIQEYGIIYFLVTAVPLGLIFVTWGDYFFDTRIWPD